MAGLPEAPTASQPDCGDVFQWLELASIHHADKLAVVDRGRDATSTYSQLHRESAALAFWLDKQGIGRGDAIAVHCRNSAAVMRIHFAAAALHAVVVNLNINLASRELKYILDDSRAKLVFVDQLPPGLRRDPRRVRKHASTTPIHTIHTIHSLPIHRLLIHRLHSTNSSDFIFHDV